MLTGALFAPKDLLAFALQMENDINLKMSKGDVTGARKVVVAFIDFTLKAYNDGKLRDPTGISPPITKKAAVVKLIDGLLCWVGLPASGLTLDSPVTTAIIGPAEGQLVAKDAAGNGYAALKVEAGTVAEPHVWVITRRDDLARTNNCLTTTGLKQVPLCVDFSVIPTVNLLKPLLVEICQTEASHDIYGSSLRLGHQLANGIELLAVPDVDPFHFDCGPTAFSLGAVPPPGLGSVERVVWQLGALAARLLSPKPAYGSHTGLGGLLGPKLSNVSAVQVMLKFRVEPSSTPPSPTIMPAVEVAYMTPGSDGNVVAPGILNRIQLKIGANPGGGTLGGTTTRDPALGIARFEDLNINNVGTGYTLVADAISSDFIGPRAIPVSATSAPFNVSALSIVGGTYFDREFGLIGTAFLYDPSAPGGRIDQALIHGPQGWNGNGSFTCSRYQPTGTASTRSICWTFTGPVSGTYTAQGSGGDITRDGTFSIDAGSTLEAPAITNVAVGTSQVSIDWTASSAAKSFLVRVNPTRLTGSATGEMVVSSTTRHATLAGLTLAPGSYHAVVFEFDKDVMTPGQMGIQFNIGAQGTTFTVSPAITFETYPNGQPACTRCSVTTEFLDRGVEFAYETFDNVLTGATLGDGNGVVYGDPSNLANHFVTSALTESEPHVGISGHLTMTLHAPYPHTVSFDWKVSPEGAGVPINVFPVGSETPVPQEQISRTVIGSSAWRRVEVSSDAGIQRVVFNMTGYIQVIDNVELNP